jgi:uncharacterized membrane protein
MRCFFLPTSIIMMTCLIQHINHHIKSTIMLNTKHHKSLLILAYLSNIFSLNIIFAQMILQFLRVLNFSPTSTLEPLSSTASIILIMTLWGIWILRLRVKETLLQSHIRWQLRSALFGVGFFAFATLINTLLYQSQTLRLLAILCLPLAFFWMIYRNVKGLDKLVRNQPMYPIKKQ